MSELKIENEDAEVVDKDDKLQNGKYTEFETSSDSIDKKEKKIDVKDADELLKFMDKYESTVEPLTEEEEKKFVKKNFAAVSLLTILVTLILFMDKSTIGYTTILGIYTDTGISKGDFNNLNSIFYAGYLIAQWPCHILMQKLPLGKYLAGSIFSWAIIVGLTGICNNYGSLMACRFFLGATEAVVVPACEITLGMFLTTEQREIVQPVFWAATAAAPLLSSFISFGLMHTNTSTYPWRIFMAINAGLSLILAIIVLLLYPDNPANAKFLSTKEKVYLIKQVQRSTESSIEQKTIKKYQIYETFKDPVSWLFFFQSFTLMLSNSLTYQQNQLYVDIGVDNLGSSLVSAAGSVWDILLYVIFAFVILNYPNQSGYIAAGCLILPIASGIAMVTIDWSNKYALLACMILAGSSKGITYIIALGWTTSSAAGYTKKLYRNVMFMLAYGAANIISPQLWNPKDAPRYYPSWIIQIVVSFFLNIVILLTIRYILAKRNKERYQWVQEHPEDNFGIVSFTEGVNERVNLAMLDLTDFENKRFIHPL